MQPVSALILIYDIRGFTAASRRMGARDLGAFATGAHKVILDLFAAHPPTFVKNLGDGHLLLWETAGEVPPKLVQAVMEGAAKARTAFAAFAAGQGARRGDLPRHVGIGVAFGEVSRGDDYYGVAVNLAARLQNLARPEGLALDENVFEAATRDDERRRAEFRRARVRLKGLGSTTVWVKRPFSWRRLAGRIGRIAALVALPFAYLALADAGLGLPGGDGIRTWLDRRDWTLFREPASDVDVRARARALRRALAEPLLAARAENGMILENLQNVHNGEPEAWASSQALCGLLRCPEVTQEEARGLLSGLEALFAPGFFIEVGGVPYGWLAHDELTYTQAEPILWSVAALAIALGRDGLLEGETRARFEEMLSRAQAAADRHHPLDGGGWNMFPNQVNAEGNSPYCTTLALLALLETREARQGWQGDSARLDRLIRDTVGWLARNFVDDPASPGWRQTQNELDPVSPGLTLQALSLLLRASSEADVPIDPRIRATILPRLERLATVSLEEWSADAGEFTIPFTDHRGRREVGREGINFLWHPWAVDAAARWLEGARASDAAPEHVTRVRRTLGHLVIDLAEEARAAALKGWTFVASETLYGLAAVPP